MYNRASSSVLALRNWGFTPPHDHDMYVLTNVVKTMEELRINRSSRLSEANDAAR